jgi:excisionase family DNA binding protein
MNPPAGLDEPVALTLRDVSRYLHCHYMTVYHLVRAGALPAFRLGSDFRVWRADLEKWIAAGGGGSLQARQQRPPADSSVRASEKAAAQGRAMSRGEILIVAGVVTIPTAFAVVGLVWICIADPKHRGLGILFVVVGAAVALAVGLLTRGTLLLRRKPPNDGGLVP